MNTQRIGALLALSWLGALLVAYTVIHNPLTVPLALALVRGLIDVLAVAAFLALGGALGTLLMREAGVLSDLERSAIRVLIGLVGPSLLMLGIGLLGAFPPVWLAWTVLIGLLVLLHRPLAAWWRDLDRGLRSALALTPDPFTRWVRRGVVALLMLAAITALAPPTKWDALTYHLAGPRHYLLAGRIVSYPENHFLGFPQLVEMLYMGLLIVARPQAAALLHAGFGVLLLLTLLGLSSRLGRPSVGWLAAAILLVSDSIWGEFSWPYNDLALMAYTLAALVVVLAWRDSSSRATSHLLVWAGVLTGCMMGTKYSAAGPAIGVGVLVLWLVRRERIRRVLGAEAIVTGVALVIFTPWLVKNAVLDGNPVSPFVWGTRAFDSLDRWYYLRPGTGLPLLHLALLPLTATVFGQEGGAYQSSSGPLLFGLLPMVVLGWRSRDMASRTLIVSLLVAVLPACVVWLVGAATSWFLLQTRLLFPVFPALALVGALGLYGLQEWDVSAGLARLGQGLVLVMIALAVLDSALVTVRVAPLRVVAGLQSEEDFLLQELQAHYLAMQQVNALPAGVRVLMLWEPRSYYCEPRCVPDSMIDRWWHDRQVYGDPFDIATQWRDEGYTHVLIFEAGGRFLIEQEPYDPMTEDDWVALGTLRGSVLAPVWDDLSSYTLYQLRGAAP